MTEDEMYDIIRGYEDSEHHYQERNIELEAENAKLKRAAERDADVMESLNLSLEESQAENAKLRELVRQWYPHMLNRVGKDALKQWGQMDVVKELGIEADS